MSSPYRKVFGQTMSKKGAKSSRYQRQMGANNKYKGATDPELEDKQKKTMAVIEWKRRRKKEGEELDSRFGYDFLTSGDERNSTVSRKGYIFNMLQTTVAPSSDASSIGSEKSGIDLYFITETKSTFKCTLVYQPYFFLLPAPTANYEMLISSLMRLYEVSGLTTVEIIYKTDLDQLNHLSQNEGRKMLKLYFNNVQQLVEVRDKVRTIINKNQRRDKDANNTEQEWMHKFMPQSTTKADDPLDSLLEMREYDVPYLMRISTDLDIRCGAWYTVTQSGNDTKLTNHPKMTKKADPTFLAFDIECTKAPLKFPDASVDSIFMISYMVSGLGGFLIINREIVSSDISDFEYTPKPSYPGPFHIFNEKNEEDLIKRFLGHYQEIKPQIVVTYNGDFFDWPYLESRAKLYNLSLRREIGIEQIGEEYRGRCSVHLDAFHWVRRDSYLPQGSQGLKAVTKYKLGYDPVEVDPEDMVKFASEKPIHMATYSVSDAVATFYLYEKYVHMFIFSLCTIIPMGPEDVLRKGSGTLCETLLMVEAYKLNIICPNKDQTPHLSFTSSGHLLESETYIGGKVECLETGVYRSDIEYDFDMVPSAFQSLIDNIDRDLTFAIEVEDGKDRNDVTNYDEVRCSIIEKLEALRDDPIRKEKPFIYHLDVGAMYPNIILTNRLQPSAIVDDATCAACDFNQAKNGCKRKMNWIWRGDFTPSSKNEFERIKEQLTREIVEGKIFTDLSEQQQAVKIKERLKQYSRIAYKKTKITEEVLKKDTVCMRENDFYVNTVRNFRDRRYEYKKLTKKAKASKSKAENVGDVMAKKEAEDSAIVYDSLQIAHKCILNSFYGYVMRKGARWRSMEMAGIVTKTGADLITQARILVEQIGRPLELDTDGIWCILPHSFPDSFTFKTRDGGKIRVDYPCLMLNADVHENFTNHQYQTLIHSETNTYETRSECSIFFEVDGPYRCMVLPSSLEEGKLLKKRYAVFNHDGSLAELKGFELKRRGELELIKTFQSQVFEKFLDGNTLAECYDSVAQIANHWMDILDTKGDSLATDELFDLISENRSMSRQLEDYGDQKGTSQTTARRLGEFLGAEIIKDKGLNCKFIIAERPYGAPVTERAVPTAIWKSEKAVMKHYLRKWLKSPQMDEFDVREVLDWEYYKDRLGKTIQKIITIPAALQKVPNPVPRITHPDWLQRTVRRLNDRYKQQSISKMFTNGIMKKKVLEQPDLNVKNVSEIVDIEDMGANISKPGRPIVHSRKRIVNSKCKNTSMASLDLHKENLNQTEEKEEGDIQSREPLSKENYQEWLRRKKEIWRKQRKRKQNRIGGTLSSISSSASKKRQRRPPGNMESFIRDAATALTMDEWHIVEVREQNLFSGDFVMWIMLGNDSLQKINLRVPRKIVVNSFADIIDQKEGIVKKVDKRLPQNRRKQFLFEVTLSENKFRKENWWTDVLGLSDDKSERTIERVYQQGTPLIFQTLVDLGCICKVSVGVEKTGQTYDLKQLTRIERPTQGQYLNSNLSYRRIFLYESLQGKNNTGVVALFILEGGSGPRSIDEDGKQIDIAAPEKSGPGMLKLNATCTMWVVKPGNTKGQITANACNTMFSKMISQLCGSGNDEDSDYACLSPKTKVVFDLQFAHSDEIVFRGVQDLLTNYSQEKRGPSFLLVNTTKPLSILRKAVPMCNEIPLISLPFPPGFAQNQILPSLNWEPVASQLCMEAYLYMGIISYPRSVQCARFGNVPIANLGSDAQLTLFDTSYARFLQKSRLVLWASELPGKPDMGGNLVDRGGSMVMDLMMANLWNDDNEIVCPSICNSGAYRDVCVEIDLHDLAIAAFTDLVGGPTSVSNASLNIFGSEDENKVHHSLQLQEYSFGDEFSCATSFQVLKALVQYWLSSAYSQDNIIANDLLHNVYRMINSQASLLHDPALQRLLQSIMRSVFFRLLGEFQRLGATIISASFNKIIISTNKKDLAAAKEYTEFIISTIQQSRESNQGEKIGQVSLHPTNYWTHFLFLDRYNFGGIRFELRQPDENDDGDWIFEIDDQVIVPTIVNGWNMMQYLTSEPEQVYFQTIVGRFSKDFYRKQLQIEQKKLKHNTDHFDSEIVQNSSAKDDHLIYLRKIISNHFSTYLTRAIGEIIKDGGGEESFPKLPGSHLDLANPALEFIKNILAVLQLDSDVEQEVHLLKKSLLAQIGVQEYAEETVWKNPCASIVLSDVACRECNACTDLDLCVIPPLEELFGKTPWSCSECGAQYDSDVIEWRLVDMIHQRSAKFQLQDLRCSKTQRVAIRPLARQSDCSAPLKLDLSKQELLSQINILKNVSEYYQLDYLRETTKALMSDYTSK